MIFFAMMIEDEDDRAYFTRIYFRYTRLMYATARDYTDNPHDCEDIVQDSIIKLIDKIEKLKELPKKALPVYLVYTVKSTALNFKKHQSVVERHCVCEGEQDMENQAIPTLSPEEIAILMERRASLAEIWPLLSVNDRELLSRKYILEQTDEELAKFLQCKKESVRMALTRSRRKAFQLLGERNLK